MATIYLSLSTKIDTAKKQEILIRFSHGRVNRRTKLNIFIPAEHWDEEAQQIIIPNFRVVSEEKKELKQYLNDQSEKLNTLTTFIQAYFNEADRDSLSDDWLNDCIDKFYQRGKHTPKAPQEKPKLLLLDLFDKFIADNAVAPSSLEKRRIMRAALKRFEDFTGKKLYIDTITADTLKTLENFLRNENEHNEKQPARSTNTLAVMFKILRTFFIWSSKNEYTNNKPFAKFKAPSEKYGTPYYMTIEERNNLYNFDLSDRPALERQRDIFVFQCVIGCRMGDLYKLTKNSVISGAIQYVAEKTKTKEPKTIRVPLNSIATEILTKYADLDGIQLLPLIAEQKYNEAIKEVFTAAKIIRNVTVLNSLTGIEETRPLNEVASSHLARRTFCGNLYKKVKDPNLVGSLSGHAEGSKAFARYRDIDEDMKKELVSMIE